MNKVRETLRLYREDLLQLKNVVGCGVSCKIVNGRQSDRPCVVVFVERKLPMAALAAGDVVPPFLGKTCTDVVEVGRLRLLSPVSRTSVMRPACPGVSIGHFRISAGTFGAVVYDRRDGTPLVLSNNHVLANATTGSDNRARIGDDIMQPGPYDGGRKADVIGHLWRFVPLRLLPPGEAGASTSPPAGHSDNLVDAAVAKPISENIINNNIIDIGAVTETARVEVGSVVKKSGRTSGLTTGRVIAVSSTVQVALDNDREARFIDQIVTLKMGDPGDSGSVGVTGDGKAFGLLFAGSNVATVYNDIHHVLDLLSVRLNPGHT
ncbi:MAG TPA: hypothetical protein GXX29_13435 [Firmicutes bacterium]|nr:hypothetical protein [Bacillota bacterium]